MASTPEIAADPAVSKRRRIVAASLAVALGAAVLLVSTADDYGLTWDEPVYIESVDRVGDWFVETFSHGVAGVRKNLAVERLERSWVFARPENRNLPVPTLISSLGRVIGGRWLSPLSSYRFGHCLLMAATVGIVFGCLAVSHGWEVGCVAAGSLLFMPQIFAHAHLNATDVPVSCFWVLSILAWLRSDSSWRHSAMAAIAIGLGLATKATFVLLPLMLVAWTVGCRRWGHWRAGVLALVVSPCVMLLFCPMWWPAPLSRSFEYFRTVFHAEEVWKIEVYYLGETYITGERSLPWHNAWILPAVSTPPWTLALALVGAFRGLRSRDAATILWIMGALVLPMLRMFPNTPGHDGVRLLLPSIFCLAPLAGIGFGGLIGRFRFLREGRRAPAARWLVVVLLLAVSVAVLVSMHPYEMSYYSEVSGGLPGAAALGFEISYWFEAYTPAALEQVQRQLPLGAKVWTFPKYEGYPLLRQWGLWREDLVEGDIGDADFLILYARKSRFHGIPGIEDYYTRGRPIWSLRCRGVQIIGLYRLHSARTRELSQPANEVTP
jgi:4-amino-4-deoxy-L-arabinose transferase-like glycosyltransferase